MTSPPRPGRRTRPLSVVRAFVVAALTAVGLLVFGAVTASADTLPDAGTRVGVSAPETIFPVGAFDGVSAGEGRGPPVLTAQIVVATGVAANGGRVFASSDPLVADAANAIESAIPGRVSGVNTMIKMNNGLSREVDVDLGNVVVQVKSGSARGITGQIKRTAASTGKRVIGYGPDMPGQAWEAAAQDGVAIARTPQELIAIVKEWG